MRLSTNIMVADGQFLPDRVPRGWLCDVSDLPLQGQERVGVRQPGCDTSRGRFTCLGLASCEPVGEFTDFVVSTGDPDLPPGQLQPGLTGTWYDPTIGPVT